MLNFGNMPRSMEKAVRCKRCGGMFSHTLYPQIHMPGDSGLKKKILDKSLFCPRCPHCGEQLKLKPSCMYLDEDRRLLIVAADTGEADFKSLLKTGDIRPGDIRTEADFIGFMGGQLTRRIVHDVDSFREKILLSDGGFDDRIMELMKLSLSGLLEKDTRRPVYRVFVEEISGRQLEFGVILGEHAPFEYLPVKTDASIYHLFRSRYLPKLGRPEEDEYIETDQKWAKKSGLLKDDDPGFLIPF